MRASSASLSFAPFFLVARRQRVVRLVPLPERRRVDHDGVLHDRLGARQLVVARVVHDVDDPGLAAAPREVAPGRGGGRGTSGRPPRARTRTGWKARRSPGGCRGVSCRGSVARQVSF